MLHNRQRCCSARCNISAAIKLSLSVLSPDISIPAGWRNVPQRGPVALYDSRVAASIRPPLESIRSPPVSIEPPAVLCDAAVFLELVHILCTYVWYVGMRCWPAIIGSWRIAVQHNSKYSVHTILRLDFDVDCQKCGNPNCGCDPGTEVTP